MITRDRVLVELRSPRCAREIRERLGLGRKAVESAIARLARSGLIECLTPRSLQSRLYGPTSLGELLLAELDPTGTTRVVEEAILDLYAWIQAGSYRRWTMKHLTIDLTPKALRKRIVQDCARISANHVHAVLRTFDANSIADRCNGLWSLTTLGWTLRELAFGDLEATAPRVPEPWTRVCPRRVR